MRYAKPALKKRPARAKRVYRKRATKPSKALVKTIQSVIHKDVESKQAWNYYPLATFNNAVNTSADILTVLPPVVQGVAENQRIGDDIRAQKLSIKGHMLAQLTGGANYTRIAVRMIVCQPKLSQSNTVVNATAAQWLPYILRTGGSNMGLDGSIESLYAPIDTDVVTCWYDKISYISQSRFLTDTGSGEVSQTVKFFNISLKLRNKLLKYNGNYSSGSFPIDYSPSILFSYVFLDGTGVVDSILVTNKMSMSFTACLEYEDA